MTYLSNNVHLKELLYPIHNKQELYDALPIVHRMAANNLNEPQIPILVERNLELELTMQQQEWMIENGSLDNFHGIHPDETTVIVSMQRHREKIIADIDGKGPILDENVPYPAFMPPPLPASTA